MNMMNKTDKKDLKIVFMGTPDFAVPGLNMLINEGYNVVAVITQPDRKAGRGHKMLPPPVKTVAAEKGIPVYQFEKIRCEEGVNALKEINGNLFITIAFGQILTQEILDMPKYGCINVHASLLPKLRGSAPIQWAIINGEEKTGVTTMLTALALDAGDMLEKDEIEITEDMTAGELYDKLCGIGADTLKRTLEKLCAGELIRTPQIEEESTYFPMFKKDFGEIDFSCDCKTIKNLVRGTYPMPGCFVMYNDAKIRITKVSYECVSHGKTAGKVICADSKEGFKIAAGDGIINIEKLKYPGKPEMNSKDFLRGNSIDKDYIFWSKN